MVTKVKVFWHVPSQAEYPWVWPSLVKIAQSTASREESWHWWEAQFSHTPAAAQPLQRFRTDGWRWKLEMSKNVNIYNCCIFGCQLISLETAGRLWTVTQRDVWFQWFISLSHIILRWQGQGIMLDDGKKIQYQIRKHGTLICLLKPSQNSSPFY